MGVLNCDREGCDNIMCDRCDGKRYICNECFEELVRHGPGIDIDYFFSTPPKRQMAAASEAYFNRLFPIMRGSPLYDE